MSKERFDWMPSAERLNQMLIYMINTYTDEKYGASGDFETIKEDIMSATGMSEEYFEAIQSELDFVGFAKDNMEGKLDGTAPVVVRTIDELKEYLEDSGWNVGWYPDGWLLAKTSPAGEDFWFKLVHDGDVGKAIEGIKDFAAGFDVGKHVHKWIEARNGGGYHSTRLDGLPQVGELVDDAKEIQKMLDELADGVNFCEQKTIGETLAEAEERAGGAVGSGNEREAELE